MRQSFKVVAALLLASVVLLGTFPRQVGHIASHVMEVTMNEEMICRPDWMVQTHSDLKRHEGFRPYPYPDPLSELGKRHGSKFGYKPAREVLKSIGANENAGLPWTIGYGFAVGVTPDTPAVTEAEASERLWDKIPVYSAMLNKLVPGWYDMPTHVITVLVNLVFNMGEGTLATFKNTLKLFNDGKYEAAAANLTKSLWFRQVGSRGRELTQRLATGIISPSHKVIS